MIFMPPVHFLKVIVQRGTIITFMPALPVAGVPIIPGGLVMGIPGIPMPVRSIMIAEVILVSLGCRKTDLQTNPMESNGVHIGHIDQGFQVFPLKIKASDHDQVRKHSDLRDD
jgi:hypothetical protein